MSRYLPNDVFELEPAPKDPERKRRAWLLDLRGWLFLGMSLGGILTVALIVTADESYAGIDRMRAVSASVPQPEPPAITKIPFLGGLISAIHDVAPAFFAPSPDSVLQPPESSSRPASSPSSAPSPTGSVVPAAQLPVATTAPPASTARPSPTPSPSPSAPVSGPVATPTPAPAATPPPPAPTATPSPSATPSTQQGGPVATPTAVSTATPTPAPTATPSPSATPSTQQSGPVATPTPAPTATPPPPAPTATPTPSPVPTLAITTDRGATSIVNLADLVPGDSLTRTLTVQNAGSLAFRYTVSVTQTTSTLLWTDPTDGLQLTVRTGGGTVLYAGPLSGLGSLAGPTILAPGTTELLSYTVAFPGTASNSFQGLTQDLTLVFDAIQYP
jgi:hypothetical protein